MLRRAAIYGVPGHGAEWQECYSALLFALESRFGQGRVWQRNNKYYEDADVAEEVAIAIIQGLRGEGPRYLARCVELGIPTFVVDLGWLRRDLGFWQLSYNGLNNPPPRAPDDRFPLLGLNVFPKLDQDYCTLICGQLPGDAQHDLATDRDMIAWATSASRELKRLWPRKRQLWRPHPAFQCKIPWPAVHSLTDRSIRDTLKQYHGGSAVVYNSTVGIELLRLGARVVAQGPPTVYTHLVSSDIADLPDSHPGPEPVRELLERLAYGQYKVAELSRWSTLERLLDLHGVTGDW